MNISQAKSLARRPTNALAKQPTKALPRRRCKSLARRPCKAFAKPVEKNFIGEATLESLHRELIETENRYINRLWSLLKFYMAKMDDEIYIKLMPPVLINKKEQLFRIIAELYNFHRQALSKAILSSGGAQELGDIFNKKHNTLSQLYETFVMKFFAITTLIAKAKPNNAFFEKCRTESNLKEDITLLMHSAIQRLPTYVDILTRMIKLDPSMETLIQARDRLKDTMTRCNAITLPSCIRGYSHRKLEAAGRLIAHGLFDVEKHPHGAKHFEKVKQRHLFLFPKILLFCREKGKHTNKSFEFRYSAKFLTKKSEIGIMETPNTLRIYVNDKKCVHILTAPSEAVKKSWTEHLKTIISKNAQH